MKIHQLLTLLCLSIVYVVWGSTFFGVKLALTGGLSPLFLIGLRFLGAGLALYGLGRLRGGRAPRPREWAEAGALGFLLLVCGTGLVAWSQQWVSSSLAALLVATSPVWVTLLDPEQRLTGRKWLGLLLGLSGVGWLVGASLTFDGISFLWGCLGCLLSALAWAVGSLWSRSLRSDLPALSRAGMQMTLASLFLLLFALLNEGAPLTHQISSQAWWALLYLTLLGSLVAFSAYTWLVANVSSAVVSTHAYVNPVVAVVLGAWLGGESLTPQTGLAAATALAGVVVLMLPDSVASRRDGPGLRLHVAERFSAVGFQSPLSATKGKLRLLDSYRSKPAFLEARDEAAS